MEDDEEYMKPMLPTVPEKCGPPVINLGLLIEFAVQQILHELTVLTELYVYFILLLHLSVIIAGEAEEGNSQQKRATAHLEFFRMCRLVSLSGD